MKVISTEKLPIKMWLEDVEDGALAQAKNLANLPFAFKHIAIMPDCHQGYGMPIGGVLATKKVVVPNAVGVDIGCGMCAINTLLKCSNFDKDDIKSIMSEIRGNIPVGYSHRTEAVEESKMPKMEDYKMMPIVDQQYTPALKQLGTLGGGNHFIEFQKDLEDNLWVMIHSGSRNIGKKVADHYNKLAEKLNEKWYSSVPKKWELAFLPIESKEFKSYMLEMQYCVDFALANRKHMMGTILGIISHILPREYLFLPQPVINIAHNYAKMEHHFGENVLVHRKGATFAGEGTIGIIPGSQGTKSYIVKGKGNNESFKSCSHGAGRKMGRNQATRELVLEEEIEKLEKQGIIHGIRSKSDLDEAAGAYKDIFNVMEQQKDLVEIVTELSPIAVIKG